MDSVPITHIWQTFACVRSVANVMVVFGSAFVPNNWRVNDALFSFVLFVWTFHIMIQYIVGRPGPARRGDWRADPYLCGQTNSPRTTRNNARVDRRVVTTNDVPF